MKIWLALSTSLSFPSLSPTFSPSLSLYLSLSLPLYGQLLHGFLDFQSCIGVINNWIVSCIKLVPSALLSCYIVPVCQIHCVPEFHRIDSSAHGALRYHSCRRWLTDRHNGWPSDNVNDSSLTNQSQGTVCWANGSRLIIWLANGNRGAI